MKTTLTSTSAIAAANRLTIMKLQSQLTEAQQEVTTGRHSDIGTTLGTATGQTVSLRQQQVRLQAMMDSNSFVTTRLDATQSALTAVSQDAQTFLNQLAAGQAGNDQGVLPGEASSSLAALIGTLNTQINGAYIFAGTNTDVKPVANYEQSPASPSKQAVADAFYAAFGFSQTDPQVADITAGQMQAFLDGPFADLFSDAGWKSTWSSASDQNVRSRISTNELVDTSANANNVAVRQLASAYTMMADLGNANLNSAAFQAVVDKATQLTQQATQGLTSMQATLGATQQRVTNANSVMSIQSDLMTKHIGSLEDVDPYEASSRLSTLMTQIETAYSITARIQNLSLLNYLPAS